MTRPRRPEDWKRDLERARHSESELFAELSQDGRLEKLQNHTSAYDKLDFSFLMDSEVVWVDLKEKINPTSAALGAKWPEVDRADLFVLDETVYRRIIWQGGGGYLVVRDHPSRRQVLFGPWELTLGPRVRFAREGRKTITFSKGKILLNLSTGRLVRDPLVDELLALIRRTRLVLSQLEPVDIPGYPLP